MKTKPLSYLLQALVFYVSVSCLAWADTSQHYEKALTAFNQEAFSESYIHLKNALQETPDHLPSKLLMGRVLLIDGYVNDAITEFDEVIAAGADLNLVLIPLANAYLIQHNYQGIIELTIPDNAHRKIKLDLLMLKAAANVQLKQYPIAENIYHQAKIDYGKDIRILTGLAQIAMLKKDFTTADNYLEQAFTLSPHNPQSYLLSGLILQAQKQQQKAQGQFELAYQYDKTDPSIKRALASSYLEAGKLVEARKLIAEITLQTPGDLQNKLLKVRLLAMNKQNKEADLLLAELSQLLSLATEVDKEQLSPLSLVAGITAYINKSYETTIRELTRYLKNGAVNPQLLGILAEAYVRTDEPKKAVEVLELNESVVIQNVQVSSLLCDLYLASNKAFKCDSMVEQLKEIHGDSHTLLLLEAKLLARRGRTEEALDLLEDPNVQADSEDVLLFKTGLLANANRYQNALLPANRLLSLQPENPAFANLNADLYIRTNDLTSAEELVAAILLKEPNNLAALINQSRIRFAQGKLTGSRASIEKVLRQQPDNITALILDAQILVAQNELDEAVEGLLAAKALTHESPQPLELLANIYQRQKRYNIALSEVESLLKIDRLNSAYIFDKAILLLALGEHAKAKSQLNVLFAQWLHEPQKLVELSGYQIQANDLAGAELSLLQARTIAPKYLVAQLQYIQVLLQQAKYGDVSTELDILQQTYPQNPNLTLLRGHYFKALRQPENAYQAYAKTLSLSPDYTLAIIELYQLASQGFHTIEVTQTLQNMVRNKPQLAFHRHLLADLYFLEREYVQAKSHYLKLIKIDGLNNKANIYNNLAIIETPSNKEQALHYAERAVELAPKSAAILDTRGWLLSQNGQLQEALNVLRLAFTLRSNDLTIRYHIAYTLNALGRFEEAKQELKLTLASQRAFPEKQQAEQLFARL